MKNLEKIKKNKNYFLFPYFFKIFILFFIELPYKDVCLKMTYFSSLCSDF